MVSTEEHSGGFHRAVKRILGWHNGRLCGWASAELAAAYYTHKDGLYVCRISPAHTGQVTAGSLITNILCRSQRICGERVTD